MWRWKQCGDLTLAELTAKRGIHHTMITAWKRHAVDGMASTSFSGAGDAEVEKLHAKIGQLVMERDYTRVPESAETLALMRVIDAAFLEMPWYDSRQLVRHLRRNGIALGRRHVRRLMARMGLAPIYQRPRTSDPHLQHPGLSLSAAQDGH